MVKNAVADNPVYSKMISVVVAHTVAISLVEKTVKDL